VGAPEDSNNDRIGAGSPGRARVEPSPPISIWMIAGAALLVAAVTGVLWWYLVGIAREPVPPPVPGAPAAPSASVQIDAIRTALTAAAGTGGAMALLLAFRRQRHTEQINYQNARDDYEQREATARDVAEDARERRVTELYTAAAEQLGSGKTPVRLAGLYALERLAQNNPSQRQTIVDVWCAYLRMPYTSPHVTSDDGDGEQAQAEAADQAREEREVRLTVQRLLATHLRPDDDSDRPRHTYWPEVVELDLTGAHLQDPDLTDCRLPPATTFGGATFTGRAVFDGARFAGKARFHGASFAGTAGFAQASFTGRAGFDGVSFTGAATFNGASFSGDSRFDAASFTGDAVFNGASFTGSAWFGRASFTERVSFDGASFARDAVFDGASFTGDAAFIGARFTRNAGFVEASFIHPAWFGRASFTERASFNAASFTSDAWFNGTSFTTAVFNEASFNSDAVFTRASFANDAWFDRASFAGNAGFDGASFAARARFDEADFARDAVFDGAIAPNDDHVWPGSWVLAEEPDEAGYHRLVGGPGGQGDGGGTGA
jgi:Pentapeptide repeats (9 copies)